MTLKFDVSFPALDFCLAQNYEKNIEAHEFSLCFVKKLTCKITVHGIPENGSLTIRYKEDYSENSTFSGVMKRAEDYAGEYCKSLGLGAE